MFAPLGALEVTMRYYKIVLHLLIIAIGMLGCDWDAYSSVGIHPNLCVWASFYCRFLASLHGQI